ncbi:molecular chaperone HtpG [Spiribacter vilamensis]|uniref:Chaperone protein HtpG n=1 Tax=Spiribacter vilamensis TaxID=531306 RepID=A0A4Q8CYJ7_9GAMM|nr:molecular chaperone HtpG [Spiribacter vilamensis]RZU98012.1 molecular chaperone HtpG [Spiribacter vilamensis]TVO61082.1 molecular chaperone HtpG [Spiribacter vilamensis]
MSNEEKAAETYEFQAEVRQLLDLMIHSLYSNREIFLRELVSNAADAADRLRFEALQDKTLLEDDPDPRVSIAVDNDARTVTISDNGIGMNRADVIDNLGTIARSGTRRFLDAMTGDQKQDAQLIGQFGVGFYSAFIVADQVTVHTRRAGEAADQGVLWRSDGKGEFSLESLPRDRRGTAVTLHLAEGQDEFLDRNRLRQIVRRYSDHIALPIELENEQGEMETANQASAMWMRPKSEITDEEYRQFYQQLSYDPEPPLEWIHNKVEGNQSYTSLLFIPAQRPFDLFEPDSSQGLRLYVRRVFIMEDRDSRLLPRYLRFVRGLVDSDDLPLNVSRELLQHNKLVDRIRGASVKRVLDTLERMARDDNDRYARFWEAFGTVLKEGPVEDPANAEKVAGLLRFHSTHGDGGSSVGLSDYVGRMHEGQKAIYYLTGESLAAVRNSPHLEVFRQRNIEVLLLAEPVDEWLVAHLTEFNGTPLQSVAKGDLEIDELGGADDETPKQPETSESVEALIARIGEALGDRVSAVRASSRLTDSPACIVVGDHEFGLNMQRMLKAAGHELPQQPPVLEINPQHSIIQRLAEDGNAPLDEWASLLLEQSMLMDGGRLEDPASFVRRMNRLLD